MSRDTTLVQRLISFLKKPDALDYDERRQVSNAYDDYGSQPGRYPRDPRDSTDDYRHAAQPRADTPLLNTNRHGPGHASRLDALVLRALQQFNAQKGFVIRYGRDGRMRYCTGRDAQGRYVSHTDVQPDQRVVFQALDTGESQFLGQHHGLSNAVLCGPLWDGDEVIGVLYLDSPARSRLHRGVFDLFCAQAARMLNEGVL
jgi:hypothetical protein